MGFRHPFFMLSCIISSGCRKDPHNTNSLLRRSHMTNLMKFHSADIPALLDRINKYSIGMEDYFDRLGTLHETQTNYPPYNLVQLSNVEYRLELALAGFKKERSQCLHTGRKSSSWKGKKRTVNVPQNTSIEDWLNDLSPDLGPYQMKRKLDQLDLRMGY